MRVFYGFAPTITLIGAISFWSQSGPLMSRPTAVSSCRDSAPKGIPCDALIPFPAAFKSAIIFSPASLHPWCEGTWERSPFQLMTPTATSGIGGNAPIVSHILTFQPAFWKAQDRFWPNECASELAVKSAITSTRVPAKFFRLRTIVELGLESNILGLLKCSRANCASAVSFRSFSDCAESSAMRSELELVLPSKSFCATSATRYKIYADAAVSNNATTPSTAPPIKARIPNRSQNSIECPHSREWSLASFISAMMAIITFAIITFYCVIKTLRLRDRH